MIHDECLKNYMNRETKMCDVLCISEIQKRVQFVEEEFHGHWFQIIPLLPMHPLFDQQFFPRFSRTGLTNTLHPNHNAIKFTHCNLEFPNVRG